MASRVASNLRADPRVTYPLAMLPAPHPSSLPRARASKVPQGLQRTCSSGTGCAGQQAPTLPHRRQVNPLAEQRTQLH
jgi:hypothetical protein